MVHAPLPCVTATQGRGGLRRLIVAGLTTAVLSGCSCWRVPEAPPAVEKLGEAEWVTERTCDFLDWERTSCSTSHSLRLGRETVTAEAIIASPGNKMGLASQAGRTGYVVDLRGLRILGPAPLDAKALKW